MATEMKNVDVFSLPEDFEFDSRPSNDLEVDLHDNYDLLSQPLNVHFLPRTARRSVKDESCKS